MIVEPVTPEQVRMIKAAIGIGAIIIEFDDVDCARGRGVLEGYSRCLWTKTGKRITITVASDGGIIVSQSTEVDPDLPPAAYPEVNVNLFKCIKPECQNFVEDEELVTRLIRQTPIPPPGQVSSTQPG